MEIRRVKEGYMEVEMDDGGLRLVVVSAASLRPGSLWLEMWRKAGIPEMCGELENYGEISSVTTKTRTITW